MGTKHPRYDDDFYDWIISQGGDVNMAYAVCERMQDAWRARGGIEAAKLTEQPDDSTVAKLGKRLHDAAIEHDNERGFSDGRFYKSLARAAIAYGLPKREMVDEGERKPNYTLNADYLNSLQKKSLNEFIELVKHGAKFIDILLRKDSIEYRIEADFLKHMRLPITGIEGDKL